MDQESFTALEPQTISTALVGSDAPETVVLVPKPQEEITVESVEAEFRRAGMKKARADKFTATHLLGKLIDKNGAAFTGMALLALTFEQTSDYISLCLNVFKETKESQVKSQMMKNIGTLYHDKHVMAMDLIKTQPRHPTAVPNNGIAPASFPANTPFTIQSNGPNAQILVQKPEKP